MEIYIQTVKKRIRGLIFRPTQNGARISGYGRFASVKRKISPQSAAWRLRPFLGADGGVEIQRFMVCILALSASL